MASRRILKKDLNWLTEEVISDCLIFAEFSEQYNPEDVAKIINDVVAKRNEVFEEINKTTTGLSRKEVKERYNAVVKSFFEVTNTSCEQLSKLVKK